MQVISSKDNEIVKHIKKLKDKKYRDINNEYIIEGIKIIGSNSRKSKHKKDNNMWRLWKSRKYIKRINVWNCKIWMYICNK